MSTGRLRGTVPQPFSVLHDPVVKIDFSKPQPADSRFEEGSALMCIP
jgi:hypothetical protein